MHLKAAGSCPSAISSQTVARQTVLGWNKLPRSKGSRRRKRSRDSSTHTVKDLYTFFPSKDLGGVRLKAETKPSIWLRHWALERVFLRELKGKYSEVYKQLLEEPRVYKTKNIPFEGGPVVFGKDGIRPYTAKVCQSIETHLLCLAPGGRSQKHAHMNSAVVYVLEGRGHDIHDGERLDWEAGDAYVIKAGCVHQHFNDDPNRPAIAVIFKAKPLFMFFHLLWQGTVEPVPDKPLPGWEGWRPD